MTDHLKGLFFSVSSRHNLVSSKNYHLSKNSDSSKVTNIGMLFGIYVKNMLRKKQNNVSSNVFSNKSLLNVQQDNGIYDKLSLFVHRWIA